MIIRSFTRILPLLVMLIAATITSCRKDEDLSIKDKELADTAASHAIGSFLASSGKLTINFDDSTYVFDAAKDSIAFIRVDTAGAQYFGVTAINNKHTMSFGISGMGVAAEKSEAQVAGSQFLFLYKSKLQEDYTLSKSAHKLDLGKLNLKKYRDDKDSVYAKGTFTTFLAKDTSAKSALYKVSGSFDLNVK